MSSVACVLMQASVPAHNVRPPFEDLIAGSAPSAPPARPQVEPLDAGEWGVCIAIGLGVFPFTWAYRLALRPLVAPATRFFGWLGGTWVCTCSCLPTWRGWRRSRRTISSSSKDAPDSPRVADPHGMVSARLTLSPSPTPSQGSTVARVAV